MIPTCTHHIIQIVSMFAWSISCIAYDWPLPFRKDAVEILKHISRISLVQLNRLQTDFSDKDSAVPYGSLSNGGWGGNSFFRCFPLRHEREVIFSCGPLSNGVWGGNSFFRCSPLRHEREVIFSCGPLSDGEREVVIPFSDVSLSGMSVRWYLLSDYNFL